jgi:hypothetical protein
MLKMRVLRNELIVIVERALRGIEDGSVRD